jgi:agmatine deiminase
MRGRAADPGIISYKPRTDVKKNQCECDATEALGPLPTDLGYAMPAEWVEHEATWLAWPHNKEDWPDKFEPIPWIIAEIVRLISGGERVHLFVGTAAEKRAAQKVLERAGVDLARISWHVRGTDRIWTRDSGPIFVMRHAATEPLALLDWKFNAWAKYDNSALDDRLPEYVADHLDVDRWTPMGVNGLGEFQRFVLEGGSIDVNGAGCVLTTEECLLSKVQQRNPGLSREAIEETLATYLGISKVLWLGRGIAGDDTHGHIDDTARFINATTIVACVEENKSDPNCAPLRDNLRRLAKMRDVHGKPFTIVELPLPEPVIFEGQRLPASYANFYFANAGVLVPVFNDAHDTRALAILDAVIGNRPVIPVYCRDLVWGLGTLHCMTQQQPKVRRAR